MIFLLGSLLDNQLNKITPIFNVSVNESSGAVDCEAIGELNLTEQTSPSVVNLTESHRLESVTCR